MGRPEAEKSGLLNCRMSHNFNVSSPDRGMRKKKTENKFCKKKKEEPVPCLEFAKLSI